VTWRRAAALLVAAGLSWTSPASADDRVQQTRAAHLSVLESSRDRKALEESARALASSRDPQSLRKLGEWLARPEFLARLDDLNDPAAKTLHLDRVLRALERRPAPATESLCLQLLRSAAFLAEPDRKIGLLRALAAVRPMSEATVEAFRQANTEGFGSLSFVLLVRNGSPNALALFEDMVRDRSRDPQSRVADIHASVLPRRTDPNVLRAIDRLLAAPGLEEPVAVGLIETVFDYQSRGWFGPMRDPPKPPSWKGVSPVVADLVAALAAKAKARPSLPSSLRAAIDATMAEVQAGAARKK